MINTFDIRIPYVEIRDEATRELIGIIEGAEIFFEYNFHDCGTFEIYCRATDQSIELLKKDRYVTLPINTDSIDNLIEKNSNIWVIQKIQKTNDATGGRWIIASGKEAKQIVDKRIIRDTAKLDKNDIATEVRTKLFEPNLLNPSDTNRLINGFVFTPNTVGVNITQNTQVTYDNLFTYTEELYKAYDVGARLRLDRDTKQMIYTIYKGNDLSNEIVFSLGNENLLNSEYTEDWANYKTYALIGGEDEEKPTMYFVCYFVDVGGTRYYLEEYGTTLYKGYINGQYYDEVTDFEYTVERGDSWGGLVWINEVNYLINRKFDYDTPTATKTIGRIMKSIDDGSTDIGRREVFVDAKDVQTSYEEDVNGITVQRKYTPTVYNEMLKARGMEKLASENNVIREFNGEIDVVNNKVSFNHKDGYYLGDLVKIRDDDLHKEIVVRISKFVKVQNSEGYKEYFEYDEITEESEVEIEGALLSEDDDVLLTEDDGVLLVEEVPATYSTRSVATTSAVSGVKISELDEATNVTDGCCFPIVSEYETKRITYGALKERLSNDLEILEFDATSNKFWTGSGLNIGGDLEVTGNLKVANEPVLTKPYLLDFVYPVGSVYININNVSPASFLGGTWEELPENYALWTTNQNITSESEVWPWSSNTTRRVKSALPNIKGSLTHAVSDQTGVSGAFYGKSAGNAGFQGSSTIKWYNVNFSAYYGDDSTNQVYRDEVDYVQPPAYKIHAWKRVE